MADKAGTLKFDNVSTNVNATGVLYSSASPRRMRVVQDVGEFSMTRQEFQDECDINALMARYEKTGVWPMLPPSEPRYLDLAALHDVAPDLQALMKIKLDADASFLSLPAHVRREFDNDAIRFVDFASDPDNLEQMRDWGLAPPYKGS